MYGCQVGHLEKGDDITTSPLFFPQYVDLVPAVYNKKLSYCWETVRR